MTTAPRTRRQLREALAQAVSDREEAGRRVEAHEIRIEDKDATIDQLSWELRDAEKALRTAGFEGRRGAPRVLKAGVHDSIDWLRPGDPLVATQETLDAAVAEARRGTLTETLRTVIDALELTQYGARRAHSDGRSFYTILSESIDGPERLWADLQTALQVRAEKKATAERAETEAKVSGIARRPNGSAFVISDDTIGFDLAAPRVSDLLGDLRLPGNWWLNPSPGSSYGAESTLPKPESKKKPAKKKSEAKK